MIYAIVLLLIAVAVLFEMLLSSNKRAAKLNIDNTNLRETIRVLQNQAKIAASDVTADDAYAGLMPADPSSK